MKDVVRWLPPVVWMGVIFYLSSRTGDDMGGWLSSIRQWLPFMEGFDWGHFVAYFILALLYARALRKGGLSWRKKAAVVLLCILYGITDEVHQSFVPGRSPDPADVRNDAVGAALAMLFITIPYVHKRFQR